MRITIIRDDSVVGVDGIFRRIDLSAMPAGIRAVQWNRVTGHIEYDDAPSGRGISKPQLAAKIMDSANQFAAAHGELTGKRQKLRDRIAALGDGPTQVELDAVQW